MRADNARHRLAGSASLVGVVDDVSKTITLYVDGEDKGSESYAGRTWYDHGTNPYLIGISNPGGDYVFPFKGNIDDVRIFDHALTADEVAALHNNSIQFADKGLTQGTNYCYRVYPFKNDTCPNWDNHASEITIRTVDNVPPETPENQTPADGVTDVYALSPTLYASAYNDLDDVPVGTDPQLASQWLISSAAGVDFDANIVYNSGVVAPGIEHTVTISLATNTDYYWRAHYQDSKGEWSEYSIDTYFKISNAMPDKPTNDTPDNLATGVSLTPALGALPFTDNDASDTQQASQWLISTGTGPDFDANIFYDSGVVSDTNTHSIVGPGTFSTVYYWKVRYQDNRGGWSDYSDETSYTTLSNETPAQPANVAPADSSVNVTRIPTLIGSDFTDGDVADTHQASQWLISTANGVDFDANVVYDSGTVAGSVDHTVTAALSPSTTYYWKVRYQDSKGVWSSYSVEKSFTSDSMVIQYHLDELSGTTAIDSFGSNNGTLRNGASRTSGFSGNGLVFDGVDDDVIWGYLEGTPANNFTIEAMVKATVNHEISEVSDPEATSGVGGVSGQKYLFGANHGGDTNAGAGVSMGINGVSVYEHGGGYMPPLAVYDPAVKDPVHPQIGTDWNHVVVTYTNKQPRIYLNGYLVHTGLTSLRANVFAPTQLARGSYGALAGTVDEVAIYSTALSDSEVLDRCYEVGACSRPELSYELNSGAD